jgi:hypothetical protein
MSTPATCFEMRSIRGTHPQQAHQEYRWQTITVMGPSLKRLRWATASYSSQRILLTAPRPRAVKTEKPTLCTDTPLPSFSDSVGYSMPNVGPPPALRGTNSVCKANRSACCAGVAPLCPTGR